MMVSLSFVVQNMRAMTTYLFRAPFSACVWRHILQKNGVDRGACKLSEDIDWILRNRSNEKQC